MLCLDMKRELVPLTNTDKQILLLYKAILYAKLTSCCGIVRSK